MNKKVFFAISVLIVLLISCNSINKGKTSGTITYLDFEGGFYGIVTEDNEKLEPVNLDEQLKVDGQKIKFNYIERTDLMGIHQWGKLVDISDVE